MEDENSTDISAKATSSVKSEPVEDNRSQTSPNVRSQNNLQPFSNILSNDTQGSHESYVEGMVSTPNKVSSPYSSPPYVSNIQPSRLSSDASHRTFPSPSLPSQTKSIQSPRLFTEVTSLKSIKSEISKKPIITESRSPARSSTVDKTGRKDIIETFSNLEPQGKKISEHVDQLSETVKKLSKNVQDSQTPLLTNNIDKIANMSKILTNEANALRESIRNLSADITRTKKDLGIVKEESAMDFPYHLFLLELIINRIHMKCECFEMDYNNLVITATFLGKSPIILYDSSYGKIQNFNRINVGKSSLFAMTYDKICAIKEFEILLELSKQPPCTHCVTKIGETYVDYTKEFLELREELCKKWSQVQSKDDILCTTSTPLLKNQFYISCGESDNPEPIGYVDVTVRMSFLGKEITTAFCASPKPQGTSLLLKENNGVTMYSCQKVEMDDQDKIILDEDVFRKQPLSRRESPVSQLSSISRRLSGKRYLMDHNSHSNYRDKTERYDEIFTKMNANELKIRVPKTTKLERAGKYDALQELCTCEDNLFNTREQIQFELPHDLCYPDKTNNTYTSNLIYTYKGDRNYDKDRKVINVTPTNCPVPLNMEKVLHPQKDVFILKIGKKLETKDKKTDLEIELITPKAPPEKPIENTHISQQCSSNDINSKAPVQSLSKKKSKKKGKTQDKSETSPLKKKSKKQKNKK